MNLEVLRGVGEAGVQWVNQRIPQPDVTIWMGKKTSREKGHLIAERIATIAFPFVVNTMFNALVNVRGLASALLGLGLGIGVGVCNVAKGLLVDKVVDRVIKNTSHLHPIKDEIKKVVDASLSVGIATAYLVAATVVPVFGTIAVFSAFVTLGVSVATLAKSAYELHEKRNDPAIKLQMGKIKYADVAVNDAKLAAQMRRLPY